MKTAIGVIGSNYGDEGKGLMVDYLADQVGSGDQVVVIRSNGGAQAGHTVTTPEGRRHVFHHVGSGTFAGARTHLSQFFVANPMLLAQEAKALKAWDLHLTIDPRAIVSTPYDMLLNQWIERRRTNRHGSCGVGINETVTRCERAPDTRITALDLYATEEGNLRGKLRGTIAWMHDRLEELTGEPDFRPEEIEEFNRADWNQTFIWDSSRFRSKVRLCSDADLNALGEEFIFEGAQGLGLDEVRGQFPHVTRSRTGIHNMLKICEEAGVGHLDAVYVTRAYGTRHGEGPSDCSSLNNIPPHGFEVKDETNIPNDWQGSLRTEPLDVDSVGNRLRNDLHDSVAEVTVKQHLAVTHLNCAIEHEVRWFDGFTFRHGTVPELIQSLEHHADLDKMADVYLSYGPTRESTVNAATMERALAYFFDYEKD